MKSTCAILFTLAACIAMFARTSETRAAELRIQGVTLSAPEIGSGQYITYALEKDVSAPQREAESPVVSFDSLLSEMISRETMARWPDPPFTLRQASSYDRRAKSPGNADWFANTDWSNFIRSEKVKVPGDERLEYVLLDERGPGAIVRFWVGGFTDRGIVRFYIDGASEPVMSGTADELIGGNQVFPEPLAATRSRGRNLYAPIPYAKQIKVTYDGPLPEKPNSVGSEGFFYNINYRTYPPGTDVESFSRQVLSAANSKLRTIGTTLLGKREPVGEWSDEALVDPGKSHTFEVKSLNGPAALRSLRLSTSDASSRPRPEELLLIVEFDGHKTVQCPLGTCFGFGERLGIAHDWWRQVDESGDLTFLWIMPYKEKCKITLVNRSSRPLKVQVAAVIERWHWDARSLYFHAGFRRDPAIDTLDRSDFNYISVHGRGVYMGDTLLVYNPVPIWWGEGDEKIFVDGEKFPSHFGTGTEDYYGYAFSSTEIFNSPFHGQPRASKNNQGYSTGNTQGYTTNSRVRMLDRIPFTRALKMDMEVWHWKPGSKVDYSVATFWYGDVDNLSNALVDEDLLTVLQP